MLIHAQMGAYACMDRCLVTRVDGCLCMHGRVFVHEYTGVCTCMDGYVICMDRRLDIL